MRRTLALIATLTAVAGLAAAPAASAQEPQPDPPPAAIEVDVRQVLIPATRDKLVSRGVLVEATCTPSCLLVVKVGLPRGLARKLGVKPVIGSAVAPAADGVSVFVRVPIRRGVREPLAEFSGSANLQVRVTAQP